MSQHDYVIANGTGAAVRSDLNNALSAIVSNNSGATAPSTTYAYQWWPDTTTGLLKIRNAANNAWVTVGSLSTAGFGLLAPGDTLTAALGSASTPGITFTGDLNTGIYSPGADQVAISTNGTGRLFVDSSGRVGVGTTSPQSLVDVAGSNGRLQVVNGAASNGMTLRATNSTFNANGFLSFEGYSYEYGRFDSSGRLLVGTSTARSNFFNTTQSANIQLEGTAGTALMSLVSNANDPGGNAGLIFGKTRGTTVGSTTIVQSGDVLGRITFQGSDGTEFVQAADIYAEVDGTPGANDMPGRLVFSTTADGASSPTERMRIRNDGNISIGTTSNPSAQRLRVTGGESAFEVSDSTSTITTTGYYGFQVRGDIGAVNISASGTNAIAFFKSSNANGLNGATVGTISVTASSTAYSTSSDYRLKENVVNLNGGIDRLKLLPVHRFNFIADPDTTVDGFIAHEVQEIVPEAITGEKDAIDEDGNPVYQGIDQSKLVPLLTAALQEAIGRIEALEAEVIALKAQ